MKRILLLAAVVAVMAIAAITSARDTTKHFSAALTGDKEVPAQQTSASGKATFKLADNGDAIDYTVKTSGISDPTAAHIHLGAPGTNGPVVVSLYPVPDSKAESGHVLAKGTITAASLVGPLEGKTIDDLLDDIKAGNAYVNVHTKAHPDGEIRGWIVVKTPKY